MDLTHRPPKDGMMRGDWLDEQLRLEAPNVPDKLRSRVSKHWTGRGLSKHRSAAGYAWLTMQWIAQGVPGSLIEGVQRAGREATLHARWAFTIASAYSAHPIGPREADVILPLDGDPATTLRRVVRGICVATTIDALCSCEAALHAEDPAVARVLAEMSRDEAKVAELGWHYVAWVLGCDPTLARVLERSMGHARHVVDEPPPTVRVGEHVFLSHGVVPGAVRGELSVTAVRDVVLPHAARLLERFRPVAA